MSSKTLKFRQTIQTKTKQILNDLEKMSDISFNTISKASDNIVDLQMMSPEESVLQSLKNLMNLPVGGNVLFPTKGERVGDMLFTPGLSQSEAQKFLVSYLTSNEPRIDIHGVSASKYINDFNEQIVTLNISYSFKNSEEIQNAIVDLQSTSDKSI